MKLRRQIDLEPRVLAEAIDAVIWYREQPLADEQPPKPEKSLKKAKK